MNTKLVIILLVVFALFNRVSLAQDTQTYTTTDGSFTITYPAAWDSGEGVFEQLDFDGQSGNTRLVISTKPASGMLIYPATGDGIIVVQLPPPSFWIRGSPPIPNNLDEVFALEYQSVDTTSLQITEVSLGGMESIRVYSTRTFDGNESVSYIVKGGPKGFFSVNLTTISGEVALYDADIQQMIASITFAETGPMPEVTETPSELVIRTLDRGEYQLELVFDPATCTLVNGGDLVVSDLQFVSEVINLPLNSYANKVGILMDYLKPETGGAELLRQTVENEMFSINSECEPLRIRYQIGNESRGQHFMDASGLGNIAFGYFVTQIGISQDFQSIWADVDQRFNDETGRQLVRVCNYDFLCFMLRWSVIGDNTDDRIQRAVGKALVDSRQLLSVRLLERIAREQNLQ